MAPSAVVKGDGMEGITIGVSAPVEHSVFMACAVRSGEAGEYYVG